MTRFAPIPAPPGGTPLAGRRADRLGGLAALLVALASGCDQVRSPTSPERAQTHKVNADAPLTFAQVSGGAEHTCGVTTGNVAYCWGYNGWGQLGDGTAVEARVQPSRVVGGLAFRQVSAGENHTCGITTSNVAYCWGIAGALGNDTELGSVRPVRVVGGLAFRGVSAGSNHTCGVTPTNAVYCWGSNFSGQLGDGTKMRRLRPVRVLGGFTFAKVSAGADHTCGVTSSNVAYCWGSNPFGELGRGTITGPEICHDPFFGGTFEGRDIPCSTRPVRVAGELALRSVSAGASHTCGVTTSNVAYCWGYNGAGTLGNGTSTGPQKCVNNVPCSTRPVRVIGGIAFQVVSPGGTRNHTCGVTTSNVAYCWGSNLWGELGTGDITGPEQCGGTDGIPCSTRPVRVVGGLAFRSVNAGGDHACGVTPTNAAYCWGRNFYGQLGDGTTTTRTRPVRRVG